MMDSVRTLLTNRHGGYALLGDAPRSRYEGIFFRRDGNLYKTIEELRFSTPVSRTTNKLWCVERQRGDVTERLIMPEGKDALLLDMSSAQELTLTFDCRESYDSRTWGRNYELSSDKGCLIISFRKNDDEREAKGGAFECHLAVAATPLDYIPLKAWEEHHYAYDEARGSRPSSRWVFCAAKLRASRVAFGFSMSADDAVRVARTTLANASKLMAAEERKAAQLIQGAALKNKDAETARTCCVVGLDALTVDEQGCYAGLPWFFQFWARDELISCKGLLLAGKDALVKRIVLRHLGTLNDASLRSHDGTMLAAADAPGWLFFAAEALLRHDDIRRGGVVGSAERKRIAAGVKEYLDAVQKTLDGGLVHNGPLETWMDTEYHGDTREGCRIEIQALVLASCRLYGQLHGTMHPLEKPLMDATRKAFLHNGTIFDGKGDGTLRPNFLIAAYVCPELFSKKEWIGAIEKALPRLWLTWGGLASIDRKNPLFCENYTGEDNRSYHRGDSWFWLNNISALVMQKLDAKGFERQINRIVKASTHEMLHLGASGFSAEVSSASQLRSEGCVAQLWSIATLLELLEERYG